jgi:alkanesulfonate monooxygenase SsuD/methylene tetrahydromethanopterin reductase-like flavin-dependent oxidoreductase (luciferase family)
LTLAADGSKAGYEPFGRRNVKVSLFEQVPYRYMPPGFEEHHTSVVTAPYDIVEPARMQESLVSAYAELLHGARSGLDGICVTEHSQSAYDVSPNPTLLASAIACAVQAEGIDIAISVLGRSLGKTREPLKIAEEYALLDCISGGRLIAGFPVGLSYDANLNASLPAIETRERYREHRELILKAWSEPRPFPWNGRFEKYGQVNIWPRPIQQPHPPIWIPGTGSAGTLRDILAHDYAFVYLSWDGPKLVGREIFDRYWELAAQMGRDLNPYRLAFLQVVAVSETDERAEREYAGHLQAHYRSGLGAIPPTAMAVPGYAEPAAIEAMLRGGGPDGMLARMKTATYREIVDSQVAIVGSPATVADQIEAFVREFRIGNLLVMLQNGSMPRDLTEKNISLFTAEVLPRLRPIWDAEGWINHWWPAGNAAAAGRPAGSGRTAVTGLSADPADAVVEAATGGGA